MKTRATYIIKKGVPSAVGFPHYAGSGEGLSLSPKPYPYIILWNIYYSSLSCKPLKLIMKGDKKE